ncbi:A24 family peptidase [Phyllobacterium sp. 21LDTY02-6]|uniref:prepilin peptidase n=1 Tax=unclassified Phyllobacterium TaxID=2638441 RepID=UPI00201FBBE3|nr:MULTISPECIES: A24 family peptidase [unclassified Phyllobacterium]MCO4318885.1 A24 family peptidase [Phyllobacterium sp. 21LDTY02-6]MCX8278901.1 A24 family peptidase [Phyllobacterium sp. 0TCS1.6C]MCX8293685.1 A24 family peptidase [Phyllobacterium sp. 0TCS1.6A]
MKIFVARPRAIAIVASVVAAVTFPPIVGGTTYMLAAWAVLCLLAAAITVHDLATMLIPDHYTLGIPLVGFAEWLAASGDPEALTVRAEGALMLGGALWLFGMLYERLRGQTGLGMGDIKLLGASALLVGISGTGVQIMLAASAALIFIALRAMRLRRPLRAAAKIPFGTFLAPALVIVWAWLPIVW